MPDVQIFENAQVLTPRQIIDRSLADLKDRIHRNRMAERQAILDRYTSKNITAGIESYFSENTLALATLGSHNFVKFVVNRESMVYKEQPTIDFPVEGEGAEPGQLPDEYDQFKRWQMFKKAERRTRLLGTGLIQQVWRNGTLDWNYIHNYRIFTGANPLVPIAITFPLIQPVADSSHHTRMKKGHDSRLWVFWSKDKHFIFNGDRKRFAPTSKNTKMINPYKDADGNGILPFTSVHPDYQDDEYWVESPQIDTVNVMDAINKGVTEGRLGIRFAMGQRSISGDTDETFITLGIDMLLKLPEGTIYKHDAPASDFTGMIDMIKFDLMLMLQNHGMGAEVAEQSGSPASGFALVVRNLPLTEQRENDLGLWRWYDRDSYSNEQIIWKTEAGNALPDGRHVDYTEPSFPRTIAEEIEAENHDLELGLTNLALLAKKRDPDGFTSGEDAEQFVTDNKELNASLGFRGANEPAPGPQILLPTGQMGQGS